MKKAQGMPMNLIVVAAIAIIVMVVLIAIFWGKVKGFTSSTGSCIEKKGECETAQNCDGSIIGQMDCNDGQICCVIFTGGG